MSEVTPELVHRTALRRSGCTPSHNRPPRRPAGDESYRAKTSICAYRNVKATTFNWTRTREPSLRLVQIS
jgi:hypothetical protein